jgi:hypothetical protein
VIGRCGANAIWPVFLFLEGPRPWILSSLKSSRLESPTMWCASQTLAFFGTAEKHTAKTGNDCRVISLKTTGSCLGGAGPKFPTTDQQPLNAVGRHQLTNRPRFLTGPHIIGTAGLSSKKQNRIFLPTVLTVSQEALAGGR